MLCEMFDRTVDIFIPTVVRSRKSDATRRDLLSQGLHPEISEKSTD